MTSTSSTVTLLPAFAVGAPLAGVHAASGSIESGGTQRFAPSSSAGSTHLGAPFGVADSAPTAEDDPDAYGEEVEDGDVVGLNLAGSASTAPAAYGPLAGPAPNPTPAEDLPPAKRVEDKEREERDRQRIVDTVLRRAQAAKLARTFRARLELAAFKTERGWQDATLNDIEPHVEAEELKRRRDDDFRRQQQQQQYEQQQQQQLHQQQQQQQYLRPTPGEGLMGPPTSTLKRQRGGSLASASQANTTMYDQQSYQPPAPYAHNNGQHYQPTASTSALQPPPAHLSHHPQYPLQQQQQPHFPTAAAPEAHRQKRRQTIAAESSVPIFRAGPSPPPPRRPSSAGSPRSRTSSARRSLSIHPVPPPSLPGPSSGKPLSSSDPNFSSFVDAASVLSGLSRAPSESSLVGASTSDESDSSSRPSSSNPFQAPPAAPPARPQTPPTMARDDKGAIVSENDPAGAAELMLFLAASPSPAQVRSGSGGLQLGPGEHLKGRRLFSGSTDDGAASLTESARSVFGGPMMQNGSNGVGGPFVGSPGPPGVPLFVDYGGSPTASYLPDDHLDTSGATSSAPSFAPTSSSKAMHHHAAASTNGSTLGAPTTPSRDRNSGGSWDSYLNVSPSPQQRAREPFSMPLTSLSPTSLPLGRSSHGSGW